MVYSDAEYRALERRLEILEAERGVLKTLHAYAHAIDYGDEAGWVDCFTPDGIFEVHSSVAEFNFRVAGEHDLRRFIGVHSRPPDRWHKHLLIEPIITVDGSRANSVGYQALLLDHDQSPRVRAFGRYKDQLMLCADGKWRFTCRLGELESIDASTPAVSQTASWLIRS